MDNQEAKWAEEAERELRAIRAQAEDAHPVPVKRAVDWDSDKAADKATGFLKSVALAALDGVLHPSTNPSAEDEDDYDPYGERSRRGNSNVQGFNFRTREFDAGMDPFGWY